MTITRLPCSKIFHDLVKAGKGFHGLGKAGMVRVTGGPATLSKILAGSYQDLTKRTKICRVIQDRAKRTGSTRHLTKRTGSTRNLTKRFRPEPAILPSVLGVNQACNQEFQDF